MDKAPVYGAGDYGLIFCLFFFYFCDSLEFVLSVVKKEKVFLVILFCCLVRNKKFVSRGSNSGPRACEARVITNYTIRTIHYEF